tara:strand:- start:1198 stop:1485 length:288 start_codon:yes stop_codon:yes gene_type:complete
MIVPDSLKIMVIPVSLAWVSEFPDQVTVPIKLLDYAFTLIAMSSVTQSLNDTTSLSHSCSLLQYITLALVNRGDRFPLVDNVTFDIYEVGIFVLL